MARRKKLVGGHRKDHPFGLHPDNPVRCSRMYHNAIGYLERLRCPAAKPVRFQGRGTVPRSSLDRPKLVAPALPEGIHECCFCPVIDPIETPLHVYSVECECGQHAEVVYVDPEFPGPELPIGKADWTLSEVVVVPYVRERPAKCPHCGKRLRTPAAKQCRFCKMNWHDPANVFRREANAGQAGIES